MPCTEAGKKQGQNFGLARNSVVVSKTGSFANGEMQGLNKDDHFGKRVEYHVAHLLNHYVTKGMEWHDLPQAFQVSVLNFYFDKAEKEAISHYCLRNEKGRTISKTLNVIFMELPKIEQIAEGTGLSVAEVQELAAQM